MANNRMYLCIGEKKVTLAKGWGVGQWKVFDPETIADRIADLFKNEDGINYKSQCCVDYRIEYEEN